MKKLKALSRAAVVPALILGTSFAPFLSGAASAAASLTPTGSGVVLYWVGLNSGATGATTSASLTAMGNWSTTDRKAMATPLTTMSDGSVLVFDGTASLTGTNTTTGDLSSFTNGTELGVVLAGIEVDPSNDTTATSAAPYEVDVQAGSVPLGSGATLKVNDPTLSLLKVSNIENRDSGDTSVNLDLPVSGNITAAATPTSGAQAIKAVTISEETDSSTATPPVPTQPQNVSAADIAALGSPKTITIGNNTNLNLAIDLPSAANYTVTVNGNGTNGGGAITMTGGTTYAEKLTLNGGIIAVAPNSGTVSLKTLTLAADSKYDVRTNDDLKMATGGTYSNPTCATLTALTVSGNSSTNDNPSITLNAQEKSCTPTTPVPGSGQGSTTPAAAGGSTPVPAAVKTPDTGLALVGAKAAPVLATTVLAAAALFFTARRMKPAAKR